MKVFTGFAYDWLPGRTRPTWNESRYILRGRLTDAQIEKYRRMGYYDADFRAARREAWERKAVRRQGNFDLVEGRLIYRPI